MKLNLLSLKIAAQSIHDPRVNRTKKHNLADMVAIAVYSIICGADGLEDIEFIALDRFNFLNSCLNLKNGIPCHDTFRRVFSRINEKQLVLALNTWTSELQNSFMGKTIAIDGKTLNHSFDTAAEKSALHSITAYVTDMGLVLSQITGDYKNSEITQDVALLKMIDIRGAVVTIDAIGCQKNIASQIIKKNKADYVLACKNNQPALHNEITSLFNASIACPEDFYQSMDKGHGRLETRSCRCLDISSLKDEIFTQWDGLKTIACVTSLRESAKGQSSEIRYFISSLPCDAKKILSCVRSHWKIENSLHWTLDVVFHEDASRIRKDHGPANFASLRRTALFFIKKNKHDMGKAKVTSLKRARLGAMLNPDYAASLITGI